MNLKRRKLILKNNIYVMIASTKFIDSPHKNYHEFIDPSTGGNRSHVKRISVFSEKPNFLTSIDLYSEMDEDLLYFYCYEGLKVKNEVLVDCNKFVTMFITDSNMMSI